MPGRSVGIFSKFLPLECQFRGLAREERQSRLRRAGLSQPFARAPRDPSGMVARQILRELLRREVSPNDRPGGGHRSMVLAAGTIPATRRRMLSLALSADPRCCGRREADGALPEFCRRQSTFAVDREVPAVRARSEGPRKRRGRRAETAFALRAKSS